MCRANVYQMLRAVRELEAIKPTTIDMQACVGLTIDSLRVHIAREANTEGIPTSTLMDDWKRHDQAQQLWVGT
jgi:hypothetical protein